MNSTATHNNTVKRYYDFLFKDLADPRTNGWFLITDPLPPLAIIIAYIFFVTKWGPKFMESRKPLQFKNTLVIYNFLQVVFSLFLVYETLDGAWLRGYNFKCEPVDFSTTPKAMRVARGCYLYFLAKMTELLDTVFFVLRKKNNQVSFLHLYHHTTMPMISWGVTKYFPGGHAIFTGSINCIVHVIMYFYYMVAAMGPQYQKYLWWKKYITTMQMAQFCIAFLHNAQLLFVDCGFPRWSMFFSLPNAIFFYYLFWDFYSKVYTNEEDGKNAENKEMTSTPKEIKGKTKKLQ